MTVPSTPTRPSPRPAGAVPAQAPGLPWLVADIGGTNARFGWVGHPEGPVQHVHTLAVADYPGPAQAAADYLARLRREGAGAPLQAAFALATPVGGDAVRLTNGHWQFSRAEAQAALGLERLLLLNDFEALALSLPRLGPGQLRAHGALPVTHGTLAVTHGALPVPHGTLAVIGPGTGLGVAGLVEAAGGWLALPGEGGHATLAAGDEFESALLAWVRRRHAHVSAERLLSGPGLPLLHEAVAAVSGAGFAGPLPAEDIVARGLAGSDPHCAATLDAFCALLGGFAGNVALTLGARGGVYIGGGIVPRLGDRFFASAFRERFESKGRFRSYLEAIPTAVITDTLAALTGAAAALTQPADR